MRERLEEIIDDLVRKYHAAQMKHINADRMGDSFYRKEGYKLEEEYEIQKQKYIKEILSKT